MIEDGLYDPSGRAVPKPDLVLGQHTHEFKAGMVVLCGGATLTAVDSFDVRIFARPISMRIFGRKQRVRKMVEIPPNHSAFSAPKIQPTMITAVDAFALAALTFFDRGGVK